MGNSSEFQKAVKLVIDTVSFDKDSTVQVFEATIRYVALCLSLKQHHVQRLGVHVHTKNQSKIIDEDVCGRLCSIAGPWFLTSYENTPSFHS